MSNRFVNPAPQWVDAKGVPLAGGSVEFFITGSTTTYAVTYSDAAMTTPNPNPIVLDTLGRSSVEVFLNPSVSYRVVIKDATGTVFKTADPVVDPAMNRTAAIPIFTGGDPNGQIGGTAGDISGSGASCVYDTASGLFWVCSTSGTAATAVWTQIGAKLLGAIEMPTEITPDPLTSDVEDYAPNDSGSASKIRQDSTLAVRIGGLAGGTSGRVLFFMNTSGFEHTLVRESAASTAANRFAFDADVILAPGKTILLRYDMGLSRWTQVDAGNEYFNTRMVAKEQTLDDGATIIWDMAKGPNATVTITANRTLSPINVRPGSFGKLRVFQNSTGGWTLAFDAAFKFQGGVAEQPGQSASSQTIYSYFVTGAGEIVIKKEWESALPEFKCRAWVNFQSTGSVSINASANIASVVRSSTGNFVISFITDMPDRYYAVAGIAQRNTTANSDIIVALAENTVYGPTPNSFRIKTIDAANNAMDPRVCTVMVFR